MILERTISMTKDIASMNKSPFESIKHINEYGMDYWTARELMPVLEYKQWRQFSDAIDRAKKACEASGNRISDHFAGVRKMAKLASLAGKSEKGCQYSSRYFKRLRSGE